ncbi:MAG: hypothetical protein ABIO39_11285 [Caulobacteraceae bacterium]
MKRLVGLAAVLAMAGGTTVLAQAAGAAGPAAAPAAGAVNPPAASTGPASQTPAARTNPLTPATPDAAATSATGVDAAAPPAAGPVNSPVGANATTTTPGANTGVGANASTSTDTVIGNTPAGQAPSAYPPCTSRAQDRCTQKGAGKAMKSRSAAPASGPATTG